MLVPGVTARLSLSVTTQGSVCWQQTPLDSNLGGGGSSAPAGERGRRAVETEKARLSEEEEECGENKKEEEGPQQCSHGVVARGTSGRL